MAPFGPYSCLVLSLLIPHVQHFAPHWFVRRCSVLGARRAFTFPTRSFETPAVTHGHCSRSGRRRPCTRKCSIFFLFSMCGWPTLWIASIMCVNDTVAKRTWCIAAACDDISKRPSNSCFMLSFAHSCANCGMVRDAATVRCRRKNPKNIDHRRLLALQIIEAGMHALRRLCC